MDKKLFDVIKIIACTIQKILQFKVKNHPYMSMWLSCWFVACAVLFVLKQDSFWLAWFVTVTGITFLIRKLTEILDGNSSAFHARRHMEEKERLREYIRTALKKYELQ